MKYNSIKDCFSSSFATDMGLFYMYFFQMNVEVDHFSLYIEAGGPLHTAQSFRELTACPVLHTFLSVV